MRAAPLLLTIYSLALSPLARAQEAIFAADTNKTLSLAGGADDGVGIEIVVRSADSGVSYYSGEIRGDKTVVTFTSAATDESGEDVEFLITVRFADDTVMVIADFPDTVPPSSDPSGTYKKLDEKQQLEFAKEGYKAVDAALNERWDQLKKELPADLMADLSERQRAWIEHKDYMAQWDAGDDFKSNPNYWIAAWDLTQARIHFLDVIIGIDVPEGIPGVYLDEYGGSVTIVDIGGGKFKFQINVVRGPTYHTGNLTNTVAISGGKGRFVDTDKEAFWEGEPCTIEFTFAGNRLSIEAENTAYYHGARAFFGGTYFKTARKPEIVEEER